MPKRLITVKVSKQKPGEKARYKTIPMSNTLYEMIKEHSKVISVTGKVFDMDASDVRYAWDKTVKRAGIEDAHFHDYRHTFCTRLVQQGVDLYTVKNFAGHRSITTTERYAHHYPESLRPSVKALDNFYDDTSVAML